MTSAQMSNNRKSIKIMKNFRHIILCGALALTASLLFSCVNEEETATPDVPQTGTFSEWPKYSPTIHYSFLEDTPNFPTPTKDLPYGGSLSMKVSDGWWTFFAGPKANTLVTKAAADEMLRRLNEDFRYIREEMGWPPTVAPQKGYRDAVFLFGSGLTTDNASNTELGGWQSGITLGGVSYPMVLISYYPVYCFDPACPYSDKAYQTNAVTHEGIHAIFASLPGCKKASWFHEGSNCWLQAVMTGQRDFGENYEAESMGWLSMGSVIAPFIPIECYSGWLLDGSFGGPTAQGVNENFRQNIGGVQYSEAFPTFLGEIIGKGSVPWIWKNCTGYVLEGMAKQMGDAQMKRVIQEYRARLALCDMGRFSKAVLNLTKQSMGMVIGSDVVGKYVTPWKATPYVSTSEDAEGWLTPEQRTLPGWSGANIVPIAVDGDNVKVSFKPVGEYAKAENMSCQLCYRTAEGKVVYSNPFSGGSYTLDLTTDKPANGVVFAVVCNLDYIFTNDIRKYKYDYRLKLSNNAHTANIHTSWFDWKQQL